MNGFSDKSLVIVVVGLVCIVGLAGCLSLQSHIVPNNSGTYSQGNTTIGDITTGDNTINVPVTVGK